MNSNITSQGSSSSISRPRSADILQCGFTGTNRNQDLASVMSRFTSASFVQCNFTLDTENKDLCNTISRQTEASLVQLGLTSRAYSEDILNTIRRGRIVPTEKIRNVSVIYSDRDNLGVLSNVDILLELGDGTFLDLGDGATFLCLN